MGLLKPRRRKTRPLRTYTTLKCLVAGHQVTWCKNLCRPVQGRGLCGPQGSCVMVRQTLDEENQAAAPGVRHFVRRGWKFWLSRRCHKKAMDWGKFEKLLERLPLPLPKIVHTV